MDVILERVKAAYDAVTPPWPEKSDGTPVRAAINIKGITGDTHTVIFDGSLLPPILLRNYDGPGVIGKSGWVDSLLYLKNNADVTMDGDLTLKNGNAVNSTYISATYGGGVYIEGTSLFTLKSGTITENSATDGGGVAAEGSGSRFLMEGGTISANVTGSTIGKGGGVRLYNHAYFEMTGGTITGHTVAYSGGGVLAENNSTFILDGGNIVGNTAQGGLTGWPTTQPLEGGGGVHLISSTAIIKSGSISNNVSKQVGGGIFSYAFDGPSSLTIEGGTISNNKSVSYGGGVAAYTYNTGNWIAIEMSGGFIENNTAELNSSVLMLHGGGGIGIYTHSTSTGPSFTMTGGTIRGNKVKLPGAVYSAYSGGGIYLHEKTVFTKTGGVIYGKDAGADSNEVWNGGALIDGLGHAIIQDFFPSPKYRDDTVSGPLSSSDSSW
jgi:hypothetical protein